MEEYIFSFGDKLPWEVDVTMMIMELAPSGNPSGSGETSLRKKVINQFAKKVIDLWSKAFGSEYICPRKVVQDKIRTLLKSYYNQVVTIKKRKLANEGKSFRQIKKEWREGHNKLFCLLKKDVDYTMFCKEDRIFYEMQCSPSRSGYISDKVDESYVPVSVTGEKEEDDELDIEVCEEGDDDVVMDVDILNTSVINTSLNRSGFIRISTEDTETTYNVLPRQEIRSGRLLTEKIKLTCARTAVASRISAQNARIAVKTVLKEFLGHDYYLSVREAMGEADETECQDIDDDSDEMVSNMPHSSKEWEKYRYVLPSVKTINRYISLLAAQEEADAGSALLLIPEDVSSTLHYDATTRSSIDGDWVSVVLEFSNDKSYDLRPIYMAGEDRENIINLLEETYCRMATAASIKLEDTVEPKLLWEKTKFLSTDAVSKNHHIGDGVSQRFKTSHVVIHLLCKSHTVEGLDAATLDVLSTNLERPVNLRTELEAVNPSLRSYFRNTTVVQAGMKALLKIVTPDKSGNSCSLSDDFDRLCVSGGWQKKLKLYQERRFCKLGSCANSIIQALPLLEMLLEETPADNLLAQSCRIYLDCEIFITELRLLSYFNYHVTFPFLHAVEKCSTPDLKQLLPKLHQDLLNGDLSTLQKYVCKSKIGNVDTIDGELEAKMIKLMTVGAAKCVQRQCGREFGFPSEDDEKLPSRAADLSTIPDEELKHAPTNNLVTERRLSVFSRLSETAKYKTKRHTGELLRDNMVLANAEVKDIEKSARAIQDALQDMNKSWTEKQKDIHLQKLKEKIAKKKKNVDLVLRLIETCKSWGGPCCSLQELQKVRKSNPDLDEKIVKTELQFYVHTHKADRAGHPELFRQRDIKFPKMLENLSVLLADENRSASRSSMAALILPTNKDALKQLGKSGNDEFKEDVFLVNEPCVNVWIENDKVTWHIGYFRKRRSATTYEVEQLLRMDKDNDLAWIHPLKPVIDVIDDEQVMRLRNGKRFPVLGAWNNERLNKFTVKNLNDILQSFSAFKIKFMS